MATWLTFRGRAQRIFVAADQGSTLSTAGGVAFRPGVEEDNPVKYC